MILCISVLSVVTSLIFVFCLFGEVGVGELATLYGLWDLSSPTRNWIQATAVKAVSPNLWTTRKFPHFKILFESSLFFLRWVLLFSHVQLFVTPWTAACQVFLSFTISQSLLKLMSDESVMPSNHLILCHPLLLLPSIFASTRAFSDESALHFSILVEYSYRFVNFVNLFKELALGFTDLFCFFFFLNLLFRLFLLWSLLFPFFY